MGRRFSDAERALIEQMTIAGIDSATIARKLHRWPQSVRGVQSSLGLAAPKTSSQSGSVRFRLRQESWIALEAAARERGFANASRLLRAIAELVVRDDLLAALLDVSSSKKITTPAAATQRRLAVLAKPQMNLS